MKDGTTRANQQPVACLQESPRDALADFEPPKDTTSGAPVTRKGARYSGGMGLSAKSPRESPFLGPEAFSSLLTPNSFQDLLGTLPSGSGSAPITGPSSAQDAIPPETMALLRRLNHSLEARGSGGGGGGGGAGQAHPFPPVDLTSPYWYHSGLNTGQTPPVLKPASGEAVILDALPPITLQGPQAAPPTASLPPSGPPPLVAAKALAPTLQPPKIVKHGPGRPSKQMLAERARIKEAAAAAVTHEAGPFVGESNPSPSTVGGKRHMGEDTSKEHDIVASAVPFLPPAARPSLNKRSSMGRPQGEHGFYGVRSKPKSNKFIAEVLDSSGTRVWMATCSTPEEAARAYDSHAARLLGPKAPLNFPTPVAPPEAQTPAQEPSRPPQPAFQQGANPSSYPLSHTVAHPSWHQTRPEPRQDTYMGEFPGPPVVGEPPFVAPYFTSAPAPSASPQGPTPRLIRTHSDASGFSNAVNGSGGNLAALLQSGRTPRGLNPTRQSGTSSLHPAQAAGAAPEAPGSARARGPSAPSVLLPSSSFFPWALAPPGENPTQEWAEDEEEAFVREFPPLIIDYMDMDKGSPLRPTAEMVQELDADQAMALLDSGPPTCRTGATSHFGVVEDDDEM